MCRRTRQIVSFFLGERDTTSCQQLWQRVSLEYSGCPLFTDAWQTYPDVLPMAQHHPFGKETGETAHVERWNNTLRQHLARYVRKTLSFSKLDRFRYWMTLWFIIEHNQRWASLTL